MRHFVFAAGFITFDFAPWAKKRKRENGMAADSGGKQLFPRRPLPFPTMKMKGPWAGGRSAEASKE